MTIFTQIRAGHRRLHLLVAGILEAPATERDAAPLTEQLCDEVEAQAAAEEEIFYTALLALGSDPTVMRRVVDAHDETTALAGSIAEMEIGSAEWRAGMRKLSQGLDRHIKEEEELLALARPLIAKAQAGRLGERYLRAKADWIDTFGRVPQPVPLTAPAPAPVPTMAAQADRLSPAGRPPAALASRTHGWLRKPATSLRIVARGAVAMAPVLWKRRQAAGHR
jgi:Hemerythrin HHE cation binding domain